MLLLVPLDTSPFNFSSDIQWNCHGNHFAQWEALALLLSSHSNGYHGNRFILGSFKTDKSSVVINFNKKSLAISLRVWVAFTLVFWVAYCSVVLIEYSNFRNPGSSIRSPSFQRGYMDTKRIPADPQASVTTEVDEGSPPMSSKVQSNLVRIPHFLSANWIYSDLKCLFENANCTKSFPTSSARKVSLFQDKVAVSS